MWETQTLLLPTLASPTLSQLPCHLYFPVPLRANEQNPPDTVCHMFPLSDFSWGPWLRETKSEQLCLLWTRSTC